MSATLAVARGALGWMWACAPCRAAWHADSWADAMSDARAHLAEAHPRAGFLP